MFDITVTMLTQRGTTWVLEGGEHFARETKELAFDQACAAGEEWRAHDPQNRQYQTYPECVDHLSAK
jgi:hypothetical protein